MFYQLPPVGNPITLSVNQASSLPSFLSPGQSFFYQSGTAALAAAILAARKSRNDKWQDKKQLPEVILPAYGCPDLVSAAVYAGVKPVLVDLEVSRPWYDLARLAQAITENTVAIVGVNLFGLAERWPQLRQLADLHDIVLIEDSAQYFPGAGEEAKWYGDLVVFSFGRGKPVSLLGGGAVVSKNKALFDLLPDPVSVQGDACWKDKMVFNLKAWLYNTMISPNLYWLPQALPFLHLGETRYHTLYDVDIMDQVRSVLLATNIESYQDDIEAMQCKEKISSILAHQDKVVDLPGACGSPLNRRLLRYPLLLDAAVRDRVYQRLKQAGLGPSIMYPSSLPKIVGVSDLLGEGLRFPNAEDFASRVLTLPTHNGVSGDDIDKMKAILSEVE
jgi:dTDP-4-amino-4,6-dideoxygalactose transaminase